MDTKELLKKVRRLEIKTKGLTNQIFSGEYHSAFKGRGMAFSEVREYQIGDEIRTIDWNVTARFNSPYVKVFEEERELTVMLLVDVSGSQKFGTKLKLKKETVTEISAVLAFSAIQNNDKIGVIFFSDKIEKFIPPKKGKSHVLRIIRDLIEFEPESHKTDLSQALKYLTNAIKKKSIVFMLSDFLDHGMIDAMKIANSRHDLVAIKVYDERETTLPNIGLAKFLNPETGKIAWKNTSNKKVREAYNNHYKEQDEKLKTDLKRAGIDMVEVNAAEDYVKPLMLLFKKREG